MKPAFLLSIICATAISLANTDTTESGYSKTTKTRYANYIGFAGGSTTGFGISFRKWFPNKWGFQINLFPYYQETKYPNDENNERYDVTRDSGYFNEGTLSLGVTLLHSIAESKYIRFISYIGCSDLINYREFDYHKTTQEWSDTMYIDTYEHVQGKNQTNLLSLGGGCGVEFFVWRIGFHAMFGLRGTYELSGRAKSIGPTGEAGIHFRY